jgi:hypothetical protein
MRDTPLLAAVAAAARLGAMIDDVRTMGGGRDALAVDNEESESSGANDDELVAAIELGTDVLALAVDELLDEDDETIG